jgi:hypothetical protein
MAGGVVVGARGRLRGGVLLFAFFVRRERWRRSAIRATCAGRCLSRRRGALVASAGRGAAGGGALRRAAGLAPRGPCGEFVMAASHTAADGSGA